MWLLKTDKICVYYYHFIEFNLIYILTTAEQLKIHKINHINREDKVEILRFCFK